MAKPVGRDFYRGNLIRQMAVPENILIESDRAVVIHAIYPKAQYHFVVVAKEDIENVTKLTDDHLPLLDHMLDLAHQIIEKEAKDIASNFRLGFKAHAFMNRLNLHVVSDDFHSFSMRRINHWNSFHTELFLPFQTAYMMLQVQGCIEEMSQEKADKLKYITPLQCNQCDFSTKSIVELKAHLFIHWQKRESEREHKQRIETLTNVLDAIKLEEIKYDAEKDKQNKEIEAADVKEKEQIFKAQQKNQPYKFYPNYQNPNQAQQGSVPNVKNYPQQQYPNNPFPHKKYPNLQAQMSAEQSYMPYNSNMMMPQSRMNPNNPFRQPPSQFHQQRPNAPRPNFNPRMHFPCGPPRQPHPNYPSPNYQGPRYSKHPQNGQQSEELRAHFNKKDEEKPIPNQRTQYQKHQQKPPSQQQQQSENAKANHEKDAATTGKPFVKKKWPKKKTPNNKGKAQGAAASGAVKTESSGSQEKPAST